MTELWLGPDLNADLLPLVQQPELWPIARSRCVMLQMFEQQIGSDTENQYDIGLNYYPRLRDAGFFAGLTVPLAIETPGLKAWDTENGVPTGKQAAYALTRAINRVLAAGGALATYSMDDPLAASLSDFPSPVPIETVTEVLCRVARAGSDMGVQGGITEAYPTCSVSQIVDLFGHVQQAGWSPRHLHTDIDEQHAKDLESRRLINISSDLRDLQNACRAWGIPFGIILNGQRGDTPEAYRAGFWEWFTFVRERLGGDPDRYILESWKKKNLPVNLPETDGLAHTGLLREVAEQLHTNTPETPMKWIQVTVVENSNGTTLANPNGTVRSLNPAHNTPPYGPYHWEERQAGSHGGYELCGIGGGTVSYSPLGEYVVFGFGTGLNGFSIMTEEPLKIETIPLAETT